MKINKTYLRINCEFTLTSVIFYNATYLIILQIKNKYFLVNLKKTSTLALDLKKQAPYIK